MQGIGEAIPMLPYQLDYWLHTASQVGICTLKIFEKVHAKRFADLDEVRQSTFWRAGLKAPGHYSGIWKIRELFVLPSRSS